MTIGELRKYLKKFPQDLPVAYSKYSEYVLLEPKDSKVEKLCEARPDGWIQDVRPDMPTVEYFVIT